MKKTIILIILAIILLAAAAALIAVETLAPPLVSEPEPPAEEEEKTYSGALYLGFMAASETDDYITMNRLYDENMALTGVPFPTDGDYDRSHGGLIYTYPFDVKVTNDKRISGNLYVVLPEVKRDALSYTESDYIAIDRRDRSDPEIVVIDSYRAEDTALIEKLCELLLGHEEAYPTDWDRTLNSMITEWQIHNAAYALDYRVDHSKDVNLNNKDENTDWLARAAEEMSKG